ncbi:MAG: CdaR family protein [Candidatus Electrothrix sp. GW3-4]|uniref:CdaR family protein n=1 Tax=Candidatus Electrothrix sp. GW3-4 TaxID=3126740 RepID=UPI0030D3AA65
MIEQLHIWKRKVNYKDLLLKLVALALGILVWFLAVGTDQMDVSMRVPIEVLNLPKNLVIYNQYQKEVSVILRGPRGIIQEVRNRPPSLSLDLSEAKPDTIVLNTESLSFPLPSGISILRMQPASITLSIDKLVERELPLTAVTEGDVADGYFLKEVSLNPNKILVSGPASLITQEQVLKTYVINLSGLNHSTTLPVHLDLSPEFMELIGETTVVAKLAVADKFVEKKVRNIPINIRDSAQEVRVKPDSLTVVAGIPEKLISETPVLSMLFRASVSAGSGEFPRQVPVTVNGVSVPGHEPIKIISHKPTEVKISLVEKKE